MNNEAEALRLANELENGYLFPRVQIVAELRRLHEVNQELVEAAQKVLSNKRGEGDWLILSTYCEDLEAAIAKAKEDKK